MKSKIFIVTSLIVCFFFSKSNAETAIADNSQAVKFNSIYVAANKTTTLMFPARIKNFTTGSDDIKVIKVEGSDNVLHVKANIQHFSETSMAVVTIDGNIYSFHVNFSLTPLQLVFKYETPSDSSTFPNDESTSGTITKTGTMAADVASTANRLLENKKRVLLGVHDRNAGMVLKLLGVHRKNDVLYFKLECQNNTDQRRVIDTVQYYIKDDYKNALNVFQQTEIKPLTVLGNHSTIEAKSSQVFVVAVPAFVVPYLKYFAIEVNEKSSAEKLLIKVRNDLVEEARVVNP